MLRVLKAREFKVADAFKMWLKWVDHRREFQAENISEESIARELATKKMFLHKVDKQNRPCIIILPRNHFPDKRDWNEFVRMCIFIMEKACK